MVEIYSLTIKENTVEISLSIYDATDTFVQAFQRCVLPNDICVFVYLRICIFVYLCTSQIIFVQAFQRCVLPYDICVFVYLRICVLPKLYLCICVFAYLYICVLPKLYLFRLFNVVHFPNDECTASTTTGAIFGDMVSSLQK